MVKFVISRSALTYGEEWNKTVAFQKSSLLVGKFGPDFLECSHLLACDRFRAAGRLEHIREVFDDNTYV